MSSPPPAKKPRAFPAVSDADLLLPDNEWRRLLVSLSLSPTEMMDLMDARTKAVTAAKDEELVAAIAAKEEELAVKDEEHAAELAEKDAECAAMKDKYEISTRRLQFLSGTPSARYRCIQEFVPSQESIVPWPSASVAEIAKAWSDLKAAISASREKFKPEDTHLHPLFHSVIQSISSSLGCNFSSAMRPRTLTLPYLVPDLVYGTPGIVRFSWADVCIVVELKSDADLLVDGSVEAVEYLDKALAHRTPSSRHRVAIAASFDQMEGFYSDESLRELKRTAPLELFPEDWRKRAAPTAGFRQLCHLLKFPFPVQKRVELADGKTVAVVSNVYETSDTALYLCKRGRVSFAVKVGLSRFGKSIIPHFERRNYQELWCIPALRPFLVPPVDIPIKDGFAMEFGEPLLHWLELRTEELKRGLAAAPTTMVDNETVLTHVNAELKLYLLQVLRGLECLHAHDWCHRDIRPANIILWDGSARLVDLATAARLDALPSRSLMQGMMDPFWPDNVELFMPDGRKWDLICFGYSVIAMSLKNSELQPHFGTLEKRHAFVDSLLTATRPSFQLARTGAQLIRYVESLEGQDMGVAYQHCIDMLGQ